jgi:serine/threonine-protein kinase
MRNDIERYLAGHPVHAAAVAPVLPVEPPTTITQPTPVVAPVPVPQEPQQHRYDDRDDRDDRGTRPGLLIFLALLLLLVLGLAAYFLPKMFASPDNQVEVPKVVGMSVTKARTTIGDAKLAVPQPSYAHSSSVPANHVISQNPDAGEFVDQGTDVDLTVSLGKQPTQVPYLIGQTQQAAQASLTQARLTGVFHRIKSDEPPGTVVRTTPAANTQVPQGTPVDVYISKGPQKVPNVVGMQQSDAEQALRDAGYVPVPVNSSTSDAPAGQVIQQIPGANQPEPQGTQVTIVVSTGPSSPPTSEPTSPATTPSVPISPSAKPED